jgi:hypothetical protein
MNTFHLPNQFTEKFPDMKQEIAEKHFNKYLEIMRNELLRQLPYVDDDIVNINLDKLWSYRFRYKYDHYYIWKEFSELVPFVYITNTGSNLKNHISKGKILDQKLLDLLIDTADTSELVKMYYGSYDISDMVMIPIDMKSLRGYIASTEYQLANTNTNNNHRNKMLANLRQAKYIKLIAEYYYPKFGTYVLPHIPSKSVYGRTYYKGINLQNVTKEVRAAILGKHYQYDLYAAIFAIKLYLANEILQQQGSSVWHEYSYTTEYLEQKDQIRSRLGRLIQAYPDGKKLVKEAITAIGFGARLSGGAWLEGLVWQTSSIKDIIKNRDDFKRFANDSWLRNFHKEQKDLTNLIVNDYLQNESFVNKIKDLPDIKSVNGNWSKQKIMSYIFQHTETNIINFIVEHVNPIICIHDAFLVKDKITSDKLLDIKLWLNQNSEFFKLEMTEIEGWNSFESVTQEIEHKEFIKQQERLAKGYKSEHAQTDNIPVVKRKIEKVSTIHDGKCYDSYDEGRNHESYDVDSDEYLNDMTLDERREHFRILGHDTNKLPDHVQKLFGKQSTYPK